MARYLRDRGIGRGDRIGVWAPNSPEWVAAFFGAAMRGAVAVLIDSDVTVEGAADIAARERCRLVFCAAAQRIADPQSPIAWIPLTSMCATPDDATFDDDVVVAVDGDDPVALLFSSGTTAAPAGVLLSHRNVMCQAEPFRRWRRVLSFLPIRMLVLPPASHALGLVSGLVLPLAIGLSVVYTAGTRATTWARVIRDHRIALALAVPRVLQVLERHVRSAPFGSRRRSLETRLREAGHLGRIWWPIWARGEVLGRPLFRLFLVGGAHLPPETARFWRRTCVLVVQGYGLAETSGIVSLSNPFAMTVGDVGRPSRTRHVELAPDGEILVRGPHVALNVRGGNGDAAPTDVVLATGDLGRIDHHGRLTILGRKKDVIVTAEGFNVHPDQVEAALVVERGVLDGAVISTAGAAGEEVHAVLRLADGTEAATAVQNTNARLAPHQRIRSWTIWPDDAEIPRNRMGKVLRSEVAVRARPAPQHREGRASIERVTLAHLVGEPDRTCRLRLVARYLTQDPAPTDAADLRLAEDLGLSSLDIVELIALVESSDSATRPMPSVAPGATLAGLRAQLAARDKETGSSSGAEVPTGPAGWTRPLHWLQPVTRPLVTFIWISANVAIDAHWDIEPRRLECPFVIAAAPHRHWLDAFAISRALPWRFARRMHVLVDHDFGEHFRANPGTPLLRRLQTAFAYYVGLPSVFPFTVLTPHGRTMDALIDAARRIDRGRLLLSFPNGLAHPDVPKPDLPGLGVARLAVETGCHILPVHIDSGDVSFDWRWRRPRQRIGVRFGTPIPVGRDATPAGVSAALDAWFTRLNRQSRPEGD